MYLRPVGTAKPKIVGHKHARIQRTGEYMYALVSKRGKSAEDNTYGIRDVLDTKFLHGLDSRRQLTLVLQIQ